MVADVMDARGETTIELGCCEWLAAKRRALEAATRAGGSHPRASAYWLKRRALNLSSPPSEIVYCDEEVDFGCSCSFADLWRLQPIRLFHQAISQSIQSNGWMDESI